MGLFLIQAQFRNGAPSAATVRSTVQALLGSTRSLDSVDVEDTRISVTFSPDTVSQAYITKAILDLGGECVDGSGKVIDSTLPHFVERPWYRWPLWRRAIFRIGR